MLKRYSDKTISTGERKQLQYIIMGIFVVVLSGLVTILNIIGFDVFLIGPYGMLIYFILITYAILSFDLLNIREMLQKTIMYIFTAGMITVIYLITYYQILEKIPGQMYKAVVLMIMSLLVALALNPTLKLMDNLTKKVFFISQYDYQVLLQFVLNKLMFIKNIEQLFAEASENISLMLKLKTVVAFFWDTDRKCYVLYGGLKDSAVSVNENHPLIKYLNLKKDTVYYKRIQDDIVYYPDRKDEYGEIDAAKIADFFRQYGAEICLPMTIGSEIKGFWVLGEKISKDTLHPEEINWVKNVVMQVSVMVENILLYEQLMHSERLVMLGEMAAAVAHEIRNPLTGLSSFVQMINDGQGQKEKIIDRFLKIAPPEFKRLERLTDNLLALSHNTRLKLINLSLNTLAKETIELLSHVLKKNKVETEEFFEMIPDVKADKEQLQQVIMNLIVNAVQAMPSGGKIIFRTGLIKENETGFIFLKVEDGGTGINPEIKTKIFEPFFTTKAEGTGLGLAICRNIMQAHGGSIDMETAEGKGSIFVLYFPEIK